MFYYYINKILKLGFTMKYLAFSVYNIFLEVKCDILSNTEILHSIRHYSPQLIANPEKVINSGFTCKNYCSKVKDIDFFADGNL